MSKKKIITFEGIEGSGKTLHIKNVSNYLKKKKIKHLIIREPGGSLNSEKIRKLILNKKSNFNSKTDLLLYLASRSENIEKLIKSNYKKKVILIDRFVDSTLAYQHYGMNINVKIINLLNKFVLDNIKIDSTFFHHVTLRNSKKRLSKRSNLNRYDKFKNLFYKKVQKGYFSIAKKNKKRFIIINSNNPINYNKILIKNKINKILHI
jgi:dTMP kinase